jgi:YfaZ precursor
MHKTVPVLGALLLTATLPLSAQEPRAPNTGPVIEGMASNYTLQFRYLSKAPISAIPSDLDYGLLIGDPHNVIASAAWMLHTNFDILPGLTIQVGPKAYMAMLAHEDRGVLAAAFGGDVRFELIRRLGLSVFGSAFYAPSVFVFGAANNVYDLTAGAQLHLAHQLSVLGGYRWFRYSLQHTGDDTIENNVFVGLRWAFGGG